MYGFKNAVDTVGSETTQEKEMLRNTIVAAAYKYYLQKYFADLAAGEREYLQNSPDGN